MGSLGHRSAVAEILGIKVSGFVAWWMWRTIYLMKMPGVGAAAQGPPNTGAWTLDVLLPADLVQLKTGRALGVGRAHFEADEVIVREGDRADRLYVVVDGEVEVVREGAEREVAAARSCWGRATPSARSLWSRGGMRNGHGERPARRSTFSPRVRSARRKSGFALACRMARPRSTA